MLAFLVGNWSCLSHLSRQYTGSVFFTRHFNTLVCSVLLWSNNATTQQCWDYSFYTSSGWAKFAYVTNHVLLETRRVIYKLHPQGCTCFCFFYTFGTPHARHVRGHFELWGKPFRSSLLASFFLPSFLLVLLWKEFIPHSFVFTFHFSRSSSSPPVFYPAGDGC